MGIINSPNMNLPVPTVGTEPGPQFAQDVNNSLNIVDSHTHAPGSGVPITPDAMNINTTLSFNGNFAIDMAGITLTAQSMTPSINTIYQSGVDLFFVDGLGNNIQITANGGIAGTPGSISNLTPPASASYVSGSSKFVWQSNTNIAADMDFGAAIMRNTSPNSTFAMTLQPPASLAADYTLTLPIPPASGPSTSPAFMTMASTGTMSTSIPVSKGITASNIADGTITTTQISPTAGILGSQLSATADILLGQLDSAVLQWNSATFTVPYLTFTLSTTHSVTAGAVYSNSNNSQTFTAVNTIVTGVSILMSCTTGAAPPPTGTLTKVSGTGDASLTYTSFVATSNDSFTVPTNVNLLYIEACGGGGGGGVGATGGGGANGGGGAGGAGNLLQLKPMPVTPAQVLNITIGAGGAGANLTTSVGATGGTTIIDTMHFIGAQGGFPGAYNGSSTVSIQGRGGLGRNSGVSSIGSTSTSSGNGGNNSSATTAHTNSSNDATLYTFGPNSLASSVGSAGGNSDDFTGGSAGTNSPSLGGGGGGGGASDFSNGANGQNGNSTAAAANAGVAAGGGGGSGDAGGIGGAGGRGQLTIYWLGHP